MSRQSDRISVPDELRDMLLEFTINYLLEQPRSILDFAVDYFARLRDGRVSTSRSMGHSDSADDSLESMEDEVPLMSVTTRRKSVFAEAYNPEDDDEEEGEKIVFPKTDVQRKRLAEAIADILLFKSLDKEQMTEILDAMFEMQVKPEDYIIKQGEDGDNFYVIESGIFNAYVQGEEDPEPKHVFTYNNMGCFGELALLYNLPRAASVKATTNGLLWALDRLTFRRICLKSAFRKRKMYEKIIETVPILSALQSYERMNVADALQTRTYDNGDIIIKQGDAADGMFFVETGQVRITVKSDDGKEIEVNRVQTGGYFGELALVTHKPRAANAYAVGDVKLAFLEVGAFERLLGPCMNIMKRNIGDYEEQLVKIFGSKADVSDVR